MKKKIIIPIIIIILAILLIGILNYSNKPIIKIGYEGDTGIQLVGAELPYEYYEIYKSGKIRYISGVSINGKGKEKRENKIIGTINNFQDMKEKILDYSSNSSNSSIYYVIVDNKNFNITLENYNEITNLIKEKINN